MSKKCREPAAYSCEVTEEKSFYERRPVYTKNKLNTSNKQRLVEDGKYLNVFYGHKVSVLRKRDKDSVDRQEMRITDFGQKRKIQEHQLFLKLSALKNHPL
ncbi:hypothetical protein TNCT_381551 [Trichonephila clavata]|uniref:Uncharacterized protein n=1 Tax=Trichonephila clavata TaxID=2740835 RepID=A0A8X6FBB0_TRICU|nr:hypothetical protein TNCT_381551 [Trichonephila clavata]